jgi:hypothetical protein
MQIGIGGAAGDEYDALRHYLPNPALGPHDPVTAVQLAAFVLIKDKGAPTNQPIDAYLPYARAYNGSGPAADAYAARVIADAHSYQGPGSTTFVSETFSCPATAAGPGGYANPLAHAPHAIAERIDMGVDYADPDPEPIDTLAAGTVTYAGPQGGGWQPNCINYTLAQPATPTERYVYICEGIAPTAHTGENVQAGQQLATFIPGRRHRDRIRGRPRKPRLDPRRGPRPTTRDRRRRRQPHLLRPDHEQPNPASRRTGRTHRRSASRRHFLLRHCPGRA